MRPWKGSITSTIRRTIAVGGEEFPAELALGHCEGREEILVNLAENVAVDGGKLVAAKQLKQLNEGGVLEASVTLRQDIAEVFVLGLNCTHGVVNRLGDAGSFREV